MDSQFFVSCPVHFENELKAELFEVWPFLLDKDGRPHASPLNIIMEDKGGILIECPTHLGLQLNFFLKTAHRVVLRWKSKKIKDFQPLVHWLKELRPEAVIGTKKFRLKVEASKSRLNNEKRIAQVFHEVFEIVEDETATLLAVRVFDDVFTLSWDTSGDHLHKRSLRVEHGGAPLRETLAAFCVRQMLMDIPLSKQTGMEWIDPMAGSGTLLIEALSLYQPVSTRSYAFQNWKTSPALLKSKEFLRNFPAFPVLGTAIGFDRDPSLVDLMKKRGLTAHVQDLFQSGHEEPPTTFRAVVVNPPYGERLKAEFGFDELLETIQKKLRPDLCGILLPQHQAQSLSRKVKPLRTSQFLNGGLPVEFLIFAK